MRMYASIAKVEPQDDGTLKVYGFASSSAVDSDGETVAPAAMKAAIPDYMKFGAVREMHQPLAAGTALDIAVEDDGKTSFSAHIVDPIAVKKVTTSVYKGFSIGGKVLKRDPDNAKNITELKLVEVSLVDRPANPEAVFTMYKAEDLTEKPDAEKEAIAEIAKMLNDKRILPTQILKAAAAAIAPVVPRKPIAFEAFKKGMSQVCQFASLLQDAQYLASSAGYEAEYEGDGSKVPEDLRAWLAQGVAVFTSMAAEETAEMLASLKPPADTVVDIINSADKPGDVGKKGATFSAASKEKLADIHKSMLSCCDKMDALGYKSDDDAAMAAPVTDTKAAAAATAAVVQPNTAATPESAYAAELAKDLARAGTAPPSTAKADEAGDLFKAELAKRDAVIDALTKRLEVIEAQPAAPKGALRAVTKGEDVGGAGADKDAVAILASATPEEIAKAQIIQQFRTGGRRIGG